MRFTGTFRGDEIIVTLPLSVNLPLWLLLTLPDWYGLDGIKANCGAALRVMPFVLAAGTLLGTRLFVSQSHRRDSNP